MKPGRRGICKVRFNKEGTLYTPAGYVAALQCDPTEKKPFFHCLPGSDTLTFGMLGCDFHCGYCQNWLTSQALRDDAAGVMPSDVTPDALVALARRQGARMVGSSYNEPLITAEWAVDVFKAARPAGLKTAFISNGNATPEVLDYIRPWTDCYKIDLKAMDDKRYRELGGVLQHVVDAGGIWRCSAWLRSHEPGGACYSTHACSRRQRLPTGARASRFRELHPIFLGTLGCHCRRCVSLPLNRALPRCLVSLSFVLRLVQCSPTRPSRGAKRTHRAGALR